MRLHVEAKRYLCQAEPGYWDRLSEASGRSLRLQGGPLTAEAAARFAAGPHAEAALRLRRWDDEAKAVGLVTPDFAHFRPCLDPALPGGGVARVNRHLPLDPFTAPIL